MNLRRRYGPVAADELNRRLTDGQDDHTVFLSGKSKPKAIAEALAALANADGGLAILGVTAKGSVQKPLELDRLRDLVTEAGLQTDPPLILPSATVAQIEKGEVVVVQVPSGLPQVYSLHGTFLTRTGPHNRPLTTPELRRLLLERGEAGYEQQTVSEATLDDLDQTRIERYLEHIALAPDEAPLQALLARGCVSPRQPPAYGEQPTLDANHLTPTVAGMLLFGRNPQRFLRSAELICVRYGSERMSDEFERLDITGTLQEQIRAAETFVVNNMRRGMRISGMAREENSEYPIAVVREAIVNAIAHRDYTIRGEGIRILMFRDRLEVYSPGRLPGHVTLENLKDERYSRNEAIVAVLSDLGYIERLGYGIDRMMATMRAAGLPDPIFEETAAGFQVTLHSAGDELVSSQPEMQPWAHGFLNPRQERALAFVREHARITNSEYQQLVPGVSAETIRRDLADLVTKNLLIRIGSKRSTYYILK